MGVCVRARGVQELYVAIGNPSMANDSLTVDGTIMRQTTAFTSVTTAMTTATGQLELW